MFLIAIGTGFLLLFAVLISDGISTGTARESSTSRTRESDTEAASTPSSAVRRFRPSVNRRTVDDTDLAA
ncbi:hypothetical protein PT015_08535 [Candidatus Mycobacterium wuenschmannii]|uniref:Secreted protein n=1 Tax=Candidatus Mycobacterium wuenschmannii TaxID=3027808 RepID=A0ABY8W2P0_9MYCO|nr:hypothetical protein [Candidatus Mycobacterium wuenschmannii]WIM89470.1 hypothetical protein PT015_08535 [Candidatus Mycobacterium wuenschmannii]